MRLYTVHHIDDGYATRYQVETELAMIGESGIISDSVAMTIASWWHSPGQPLTTAMSTAGDVDRFLTVQMFMSPSTWGELDDQQREKLRAMRRYLERKQSQAPSGVRACSCDDCFDVVVGQVGELCSDCDESGCDNQGSTCERVDAYQEDWHLVCNRPFSECTCPVGEAA